MTCKDCYYDRVCPHIYDDDANKCGAYKDKSRIVELPCKVGDFVEWDNGFGHKELYRVNGFHYNPDDLGLRYILKDCSPIVTISNIKRIVPKEEALRKAVQK